MDPTRRNRVSRSRHGGSGNGRLVGFIALGLTAVVIVGGLFVLFSGSSESTAEVPRETLSQLQTVDGTLSVVEDERLVLEPLEAGNQEMEFVIRAADLSNFDIAHMQSHSAVALPTRIYYEEQNGVLYARYKEDAPVNTQSGQ
jgi:hypothetical protein